MGVTMGVEMGVAMGVLIAVVTGMVKSVVICVIIGLCTAIEEVVVRGVVMDDDVLVFTCVVKSKV